MQQNYDERLNCSDCACFEPMKVQKNVKDIIGTCHLLPPIFKEGVVIAQWPIVFHNHGYCFSGIKKEPK